MSLLDKIFRPKKFVADQYFHTLTAYNPVFSRWKGELYESELVRAAIAEMKARGMYPERLWA